MDLAHFASTTETSPEVVAAIMGLTAGDFDEMLVIWEQPTVCQLVHIINAVKTPDLMYWGGDLLLSLMPTIAPQGDVRYEA